MFLHLILACLITFLAINPANAETKNQHSLTMSAFKNIPILQDGRLKPLDTFARHELIRFSGKSTIENKSAIIWLADTLFDPITATEQRIFKIENATTRHLMGLEERKKPLYAYKELTTGLQKTFPTVEKLLAQKPETLSNDQTNLLKLHENALHYTQLLRSFSLLLPLNITIPEKWQKKLNITSIDQPTYLVLKTIDQELQSETKKIIQKKGNDPEKYTASEQQTAILGWQIKTIEDAATNNALLRIIPNGWDTTKTDYLAPWEIIRTGKASPETANNLKQWQQLSIAWQTKNAPEWERLCSVLAATTDKNFAIETWYNTIHPFTVSLILFSLSFLIALLALSLHQQKQLMMGSFITLGLALIFQTLGIATRIIVLERPPVGTLYESILFVALVAPLFALLLETRIKNSIGLVCAGLMGTSIGLLALSMADEGDSMKVLGAVLNTQFWLTTHVLCITIGYGWCLLTSVLAHIMLICDATNRLTDINRKSLSSSLGTLAVTSLLFTATGTILGGIWADQSWGRFWGWDPKENGALLIVLWLVWMIHGKIAGQISPTLYIIGLAFLSVIVAIAWIGVNLLGIGLHSYGFIEGLFWGLGLFTLTEIAVLSFLGWSIAQKEKIHHAP